MAAIKSGALVTLLELQQSSEFFKEGASLRDLGPLKNQKFSRVRGLVAAARVMKQSHGKGDGRVVHLRELGFRIGSIFQFIGEVHIQPDNEAVLQARTGRNVDGIDLDLYYQSLKQLRQFQAEHIKSAST
ncbi:hypothetical protein V6N13_014431 [Hibiscus sabdariffa]